MHSCLVSSMPLIFSSVALCLIMEAANLTLMAVAAHGDGNLGLILQVREIGRAAGHGWKDSARSIALRLCKLSSK